MFHISWKDLLLYYYNFIKNSIPVYATDKICAKKHLFF